ncbi:MAG: ATP synthase F1 subunit epsilon [Elusimicrobiota bacterium]
MKTFEIEIISPEKVVFKGAAKSLVVPAYCGKLGVWAGHIPTVAQLVPGEIKLELAQPYENETTFYFAISGGFSDITQKKVRLLVETAEMAGDISEERARLALERAKKQIKEGRDIAQAQAAALRALSRLKVVEKTRKRGVKP